MSQTRRIKLSDVGRSRATEIIEVSVKAPPDDVAMLIVEAASKYLMSSQVDAIWNEKTKKGQILVGGFRPVGIAEEVA